MHDVDSPWSDGTLQRGASLRKMQVWGASILIGQGIMSRSAFRRALEIAAVGAGLVFAGFAYGHHSLTEYNMKKVETIRGKVVEFQWTNPHTWTWIDVKGPDGTVTKWGLEGMSPNYLGRRGWTKNTLKPGTDIEVVIHPLKSGKPGGAFLRATLPDGTEKAMFTGR